MISITNNILFPVISGLIVAILSAFIPSFWLKDPGRNSRNLLNAGSPGAETHDSNITVNNGNNYGSIINDDHRIYQETTVNTTINNLSNGSGSSDSTVLIISITVAGLAACCLFLVSWRVLQAIAVGGVIAVFIMLVIAFKRTIKAKNKLPAYTISVFISCSIGCVITLASAVFLGMTARSGKSLEEIKQAAGDLSQSQRAEGLKGYLSYFGHNIFPLVVKQQNLYFILFQFVSLAFSIFGLYFFRELVLDWHSYLRYSQNEALAENSKLRKRAKRFRRRPGALSAILLFYVFSLLSSVAAYFGWGQGGHLPF